MGQSNWWRSKAKRKAQKGGSQGETRIRKRLLAGGITLVLTAVLIATCLGPSGVIRWTTDTFEELKQMAGLAVLAISVVTFYCIYVGVFRHDAMTSGRKWFRIVLLQVLYLLVVRFSIEMGLPMLVAPTPLFALLFCLLTDRRFSVVVLVVLTALSLIIPGADPLLLLVLLLGSIAAVFGSVPIASRSKLMETGVVVAFVYCMVLIGLWLSGYIETEDLSDHVLWASVGGFAYIGILANAALPLIEYLFGITTHMTLLEISSQNHPLLRRLVLEAPGTYHHSLIVGNLAEAAAEATGSDWLLARVGSYYHDIGKLEKPLYFTENASNMPNRHENLSPAMSSLIITAHTKDGVQAGYQYGLPRGIIDFIEQHHGKSIVEYFYQQALVKADEDDKPSPETFRYSGPRPSKKEVGIVLLADSVEAATRNLSDPTPARIKGLVQDVVTMRLVDGQLDDCPLTLEDLKKAKESFVRVLTGMYHTRVKYPGTEQRSDESTDNGPTERR